MKKLLLTFLVLGSFSSFAEVKLSADEIIDRGSYVEVIKPRIVGCANGECYGGEHYWYLRPSYSKNKVCRNLGFKSYIKGSLIRGTVNEYSRYSKLVYHVIYRTGYPGAPAGGKAVESIQSIECSK